MLQQIRLKLMSYTPFMEAFAREELCLLRSLETPRKVQDFLNALPMNFEEEGETCMSPRRVLRERRAHCMEGAMLAAAALRFQGRPPLVLDLTAVDHDDDHVVALFRERGYWGAISKTNHAVLRYREPVYRTVRELVMSYFHEYFLNDGRKTLRSYSGAINLSRFDARGWMTAEGGVWYIPEFLDGVPHISILSRWQVARLRRADPVERKAGTLVAWTKRRCKSL